MATVGFENVEVGVVAVDAEGRVSYANRKAESIFASSGVLRVKGGAIKGGTPEAAAKLSAGISNAITRRVGSSFVVESDGRNASSVIVTLVPISRDVLETWSVWPNPSVMLMIQERGRRRMPTVQQLMALFRLSPAEARLTKALAEGRTPEEFARDVGVGMPTVRTQLRKVFEKTGTSRQVELMKLLMEIPPIR